MNRRFFLQSKDFIFKAKNPKKILNVNSLFANSFRFASENLSNSTTTTDGACNNSNNDDDSINLNKNNEQTEKLNVNQSSLPVAANNNNNNNNSQNCYVTKKKNDHAESRERFNHIRMFYADPEIDKAADKPLIRLNPMTMMYMGVSGDNSHLLRSSNYLRNEVPIRIAHLIKELRNLPFIVGVNPSMLDIHERCIKAFRSFDNFDKEIKDINSEKRFNQIVCTMLELNKDLLALLCDGFKDTRRYIKNEDFIKSNLNKILSARLGIRLLCEHHIALTKQSSLKQILLPNEINDQAKTSQKDEEWVGIIHKKFSPRNIIETSGKMVANLCKEKYGIAPKLKIDGHTNAQFPYLPLPLDYIIPELLKNSFRATCEHHKGSQVLPGVNVTIAINERDFIFRIRDRGGGVPHASINKIFDYHFSTGGNEAINLIDSASTDPSLSNIPVNLINENDFLGNAVVGMVCEASSTRGLAVMHGYGFGLPTSKAYAEYLGGTLSFQSMQGIGTDFYLKLALLDTEPEMVRI